MSKIISANQFLGATFSSMIKKDRYEIRISNLNKIAKATDSSLRGIHDTVLSYTTHDVFSIVDEYSDFFSISNEVIELQKSIIEEIIDGVLLKNDFIDRLQEYFTSGIPKDINDTLLSLLDEEI